jgi:hypothetical protein
MSFIDKISPVYFATVILVSATVFTVTWFLDALTHARIVKAEISERELHTHRILIITSMLMEFSLVLMYWFPYEVLALFLAAFLTRTVHEFIDELHWHTNRCSFYESLLHLVMWLTVLTKTFLMFMWGFFTQYRGLAELHPAFYVWGIAVVICMAFISRKEWITR